QAEAPGVAALLGDLRDATHAPQRGAPRVVRRHARRDVLGNLLVEMEAQLGGELAVHGVAAKQASQPQPQRAPPAHAPLRLSAARDRWPRTAAPTAPSPAAGARGPRGCANGIARGARRASRATRP